MSSEQAPVFAPGLANPDHRGSKLLSVVFVISNLTPNIFELLTVVGSALQIELITIEKEKET